MHALGILVIIAYLLWVAPKYGENRKRVLFCGLLCYAFVYIIMLGLYALVKGYFGGQNVIRAFIFLPLLVILFSKLTGVDMKKMQDIAAPGIPIAQCIAKIGCQYVGCCRSWLCVEWGIFNKHTGTRLFPVQLLEGAVAGIVVLMTLLFAKKRNYQAQGLCMPYVLVLFGGTRFFLEFLRDNQKVFFGISELALWCAAMVICGGIWFAVYRHRRRKEINYE